MTFETSLKMTLHKLMGWKWDMSSGFFFFGIKVICVKLMLCKNFPEFMQSRTASDTLVPTICQYFWKNKRVLIVGTKSFCWIHLKQHLLHLFLSKFFQQHVIHFRSDHFMNMVNNLRKGSYGNTCKHLLEISNGNPLQIYLVRKEVPRRIL